jgi:hypothetical protein
MSPNRQLRLEDDSGMCDTGPCPLYPGEAGSACSEFLSDDDRELGPREPEIWRVMALIGAVSGLAIASFHVLCSMTGAAP